MSLSVRADKNNTAVQKSPIEQNTDNLLQLLVIVGVVSILLILTGTGYGIYRQSVADVLSEAENDAIRISEVMLKEVDDVLFSTDNQLIALDKDNIQYFDSVIRKFLSTFEIVKVKVFDSDRYIIFSTDSQIIGQKDADNQRLERALQGRVDSHMERKEEVVDLVDEQLLDVDVVETYLPILNATGNVAGSIELYLDVTSYRENIRHRVQVSLVILAAILLFVFALAFIIVRSLQQQVVRRTYEREAEIKDRKRAEVELNEKEGFLGKLIDVIPIPIFYKGNDGRYLGINKAFESFFGVPSDHIVGKTVFELNPPELADLYHSKDVELFERGGNQEYEAKVKNTHGETHDVIFHKSTFTDIDRNIKGLIGAVLDITDRIQMENSLRYSEKKFRLLFENSKDPSYINTIEGIVLDANQSFLDLFGYSKKDLGSLEIQKIYADPMDRLAMVKNFQEHGFVKQYPVKFLNRDKSIIDCEVTATVRYFADGAIKGYQGVIRDVSEERRRQMEKEELITNLQKALAEVKTLSGLLPICMHCKKIRDDKGYWNRIENYIGAHSEAQFSHGICEECVKKHYPDFEYKE